MLPFASRGCRVTIPFRLSTSFPPCIKEFPAFLLTSFSLLVISQRPSLKDISKRPGLPTQRAPGVIDEGDVDRAAQIQHAKKTTKRGDSCVVM